MSQARFWTGPGVRLGLLLTTALAGGCASAPRYAESDHFDGDRFYNAVPNPPPGFFKVLGHVMFGRNGAWPTNRLEPEGWPRFPRRAAEGEAAVTFVNHASLLVQIAGLNVLTDPVWSERVGPASWAGPLRARNPGVLFERLPPIDVVLISHNHYDHLDLPTLERLEKAHQPLFIVPLGDAEFLRDRGFGRVLELDWWQSVRVLGIELVFTPAQHNSGRSLFDGNRSLWGSFLIRAARGSVYFGGDTAYADHFREIRRRFGAVDLALLPIGAYLPVEMMRPFHMSPAEAVEAHRDLGARRSIAIHFGTFRLSNEAFDQPAKDLRATMKTAGANLGPFIAIPEGRTERMRLFRGRSPPVSPRPVE